MTPSSTNPADLEPLTAQPNPSRVLCLRDIKTASLKHLLLRYGMELVSVAPQQEIPGSFWGDEEAGLAGDKLFARKDTPVHSVLHEACHYVCMDARRREQLHTNAAGDYEEESAVCYLQVILAPHIPELGRDRLWRDMDDWGYSFRLGSAQRWFEQDAEDARLWLREHCLIDKEGNPTWQLRQS